LTNEEILNQIQTEVLSKEKSHEQVSGVLIMVDGTQTRVWIKELIFSVLQLFGENSKPSILVCVNKNERIMEDKRTELRMEMIKILTELAMNPDQIIFLDTKSNSTVYVSPLFQNLAKLKPVQIQSIKQLEEKIEEYYLKELSDESNYNERTISIPISYQESVTETHVINKPYSYECNCRGVCVSRLIFVCINRRKVCDTCQSTKQESVTTTRMEWRTRYEQKTEKTLKNQDSYYKEISRLKVIQELKATIFKKIHLTEL